MNKCIAIFPVLWLLASNILAQAGRGAITGTVVDPDGNPVAGATVNVKLMPAGAAGSAVSTAKGDFTISALAAGDYELSIPPIGFTFRPYSRSGLMVRAGETLRTDIRLQWNLNLGTIGDDYYLDVRNRYAGLTAPRRARRTAKQICPAFGRAVRIRVRSDHRLWNGRRRSREKMWKTVLGIPPRRCAYPDG